MNSFGIFDSKVKTQLSVWYIYICLLYDELSVDSIESTPLQYMT